MQAQGSTEAATTAPPARAPKAAPPAPAPPSQRVKPVSWFGHRAREAIVHVRRISQSPRLARVMILPSGGREDAASLLRAILMAHELRRLGWRVTVPPCQLEHGQRMRLLRAERPDVVLLQQQRHELNRPKYFGSLPVVFDIDDADFLDPRRTAAVEECCRDSKIVLAGSRYVAEWCGQHAKDVRLVWTSTPLPKERATPPQTERAPVVAWAHSDPLAMPLEAEIVRDAMVRLAGARPGFEFWLFGVRDEAAADAYLGPVRSAGVRTRTFAYMPYADYLKTLAQVAVGLQPVAEGSAFSRGKSFGKVLGYLSADVAVVASDAVDHPVFFRDRVSGMLVRDAQQMADATGALLADPARRARMADEAHADFKSKLATEAAAAKVDRALRDAAGMS